ncbi:MAG TPA: PaaI family thioesterase [Actinomycetota bacterium]|nr:PaaI family thioesterase [Actinomycetota bacterium]
MLDPALEPAVRKRFGSSKFAQWMGLSLVGLGDGTSEVRLDLEAHHFNPGGIVHGGVLATLLDGCIGLALRTKLGMDKDHVTVDLNVQYISAMRAGALIGRGKAVRVGDRVSHGEAELTTEDGRLVAKGSATFLVIPARRRDERPLGGDA